jgi:hypothetical protein
MAAVAAVCERRNRLVSVPTELQVKSPNENAFWYEDAINKFDVVTNGKQG